MADNVKIFVGDRLVGRDDASVSVFDAGFQSGDAIWEGLRVYGGSVHMLERHLTRLEESAKAMRLRLPYDRDGIRRAVTATLDANGMTDDAHVRLMVTRGSRWTSGMDPRNAPPVGTLVIIAEHKPVPERPVPQRLRTASTRRPSPQVLDPGIHHANQLNSILARLEILDETDIDATLMLDERGFVAEADTANIFCVKNGAVFTPLPTACLHGITRETVLTLSREAGHPTEERQLSPIDFYSADEVFLTGTVCELVPVTSLDGRTIGGGEPGPIWTDLLGRYRAFVRNAVQ
ncbi:aminotransferase class IV [Microbacterium arabinogalactanolyticum]|uniref:aminotransferase class IV n=1 Tax=Microbacterium arabinogalactanolyticum TaxID=69365 RepID=UPI004044199D